MIFDLLMALPLHLYDLLVHLLLLVLLCVLIIDVSNFHLAYEFFSFEGLTVRSDFAFSEVVVNVDHLLVLVQIELGLPDLTLCWLHRVH